MKRYGKMLKTFLKQNFLLYSTVPISLSCGEYPASASDVVKIVSRKYANIQKFLRVAIATVISNDTKLCMLIALD